MSRKAPVVGMSLSYDVDAALPRFHFQSHGHPLEQPIRKAERKEFQVLFNEGVFRKLNNIISRRAICIHHEHSQFQLRSATPL